MSVRYEARSDSRLAAAADAATAVGLVALAFGAAWWPLAAAEIALAALFAWSGRSRWRLASFVRVVEIDTDKQQITIDGRTFATSDVAVTPMHWATRTARTFNLLVLGETIEEIAFHESRTPDLAALHHAIDATRRPGLVVFRAHNQHLRAAFAWIAACVFALAAMFAWAVWVDGTVPGWAQGVVPAVALTLVAPLVVRVASGFPSPALVVDRDRRRVGWGGRWYAPSEVVLRRAALRRLDHLELELVLGGKPVRLDRGWAAPDAVKTALLAVPGVSTTLQRT